MVVKLEEGAGGLPARFTIFHFEDGDVVSPGVVNRPERWLQITTISGVNAKETTCGKKIIRLNEAEQRQLLQMLQE